MTDSREDLEEASLDWELETVKCIILNVKLNKNNEEVSALIDSRMKPIWFLKGTKRSYP